MADEIVAPPQPGSPEEAPRLLPLGDFSLSLLAGALACVVGTLLFLWLADEVFENELAAIDEHLLALGYALRGGVLDQIMLTLTTLGETLVLGIFITLVCLALLRRGRWIDVAGAILASGGAGILNQVLKLIYQRIRPDLFPGPFHLVSYSFPSGHTMGSIACYGVLAYIGVRLLRRRTHKILLVLAATLLVLGIGSSRIYFGVHFPTDVLGGLIAGGTWLVISILAIQAAEWHVARRAGRHTAVR